MTKISKSACGFRLWVFILLVLCFPSEVLADPLAETPEIQYSSAEANDLWVHAAELQTTAALYEFVRNHYEFALYHGSRSGSINTFFGRRGNDVDLASTLIALLRSLNIPSRYVVGNVRMNSDDVMNWLGVKDLDLAVAIMRDQGIQGPGTQGPELSVDRLTLTFEHVWVEAFVSYENYRGQGKDLQVDCSATTPPSSCHWAALDPSFKLKKYHNQNIEVYDLVPFDYTRYYNAIRDNDVPYMDKNPLEIYKEEILSYLRTNHPGKTLEDVMDPGVIIKETSGLLPASLPFEVIDNVRRYDSVADHDTAAATTNPAGHKKWGKTVSLKVDWGPFHSDAGTALLAEVSSKRLTLTYELGNPTANPPTSDRLVTRLDGNEIAVPLVAGTLTINGVLVGFGHPFKLKISMDGSPAVESGESDLLVDVDYDGLSVGGYYLIGTGGESSNWSQVHRASEQLLASNSQYPIIHNPAGDPYVDENSNGVVDTGELLLLDHRDALDALTGGLLFVAMTQYFAAVSDSLRDLDQLNHVVSPIRGFVGVVSATHEVEYLDETAFSVMPGGLLIDMKGIAFNGFWKNDEPAAHANNHFLLVGHSASALEHETWQEMTGFDAVSTVRGIQMALSQDLDGNSQFDASLLDLKKTTTEDTLPASYPALGYPSTAPSPFVREEWTLFSDLPTSWKLNPDDGNTHEFDTFKGTVDSGTSSLRQSYLIYNSENGISETLANFDSIENQLLALAGQHSSAGCCVTLTTCGTTYTNVTYGAALGHLEDCYDSWVASNQQFMDYLDRNQGFIPSSQRYRSTTVPVDQHSRTQVMTMRNGVYLPPAGFRIEYVILSRLTVGETFSFSVHLEKVFDSNENLGALGFIITNNGQTSNGGYLGLPLKKFEK